MTTARIAELLLWLSGLVGGCLDPLAIRLLMYDHPATPAVVLTFHELPRYHSPAADTVIDDFPPIRIVPDTPKAEPATTVALVKRLWRCP